MSQRSETFDLPPNLSSDTPPNASPNAPPSEPTAPAKTARQQLADKRTQPAKRQRLKQAATTHDAATHEDDRKLRLLDRLTRWMVFLYCSNFKWLDILHEVYSVALSADSFDYTTGRSKIFDNAKAFKHRTIDNMEVSSLSCFFVIYVLLTYLPVLCSGTWV